jgi:hypothetical protein
MTGPDRCYQLALQPWRGVEIDFASKGHNGVLSLGPARYS